MHTGLVKLKQLTAVVKNF